ncbi:MULTISPECIES: winged helix-turn-helix domain-containing protein [unclassified Pseudomonas]|uniref:winged helix-turn-helix domain-containing protein n=1 Tax=unclassified Pseudomonas TaxID=196821 RepID=UPI00131EAC46|nr:MULTISPECIES: winged helix-turn-helix domain-containing protein [unclassified Pseudomonas]
MAKKVSDDDLIAALKEHGSTRKAAKALGITQRAILYRKKTLAKKGFSPDHDMTRTVPDGYKVRGVSTLYNSKGEIAAQWVKSDIDRERWAELMQAALDGMCDTIPRLEALPAPLAMSRPDLLATYIITDYHLGMLAWGEETRGASYDVKIAENQLVAWFATAIALAPDAEQAVFAQLGDFLHWDGLDAVTPTSKHVLDADTRFQRLVRVAIRVIRRIVDMLLAKHARVHLLMAEGNHDLASSVWLREWLAALYENEPRITVDTSADPYYCVEHGRTSLFFHHGHKRRMGQLDDVFAAKFRAVYGRTRHSYAHTGHLHHNETKETNLMTLEQHRTLAAADAHASRGGYQSGRDAKVITYSAEHGEVSRLTISPEMLGTWGAVA